MKLFHLSLRDLYNFLQRKQLKNLYSGNNLKLLFISLMLTEVQIYKLHIFFMKNKLTLIFSHPSSSHQGASHFPSFIIDTQYTHFNCCPFSSLSLQLIPWGGCLEVWSFSFSSLSRSPNSLKLEDTIFRASFLCFSFSEFSCLCSLLSWGLGVKERQPYQPAPWMYYDKDVTSTPTYDYSLTLPSLTRLHRLKTSLHMVSTSDNLGRGNT